MDPRQNEVDAVVIGGGACGLMCAVQAGYLGKKVLLLERNNRLGAKILISGGGRCNYTNLYTTAYQFVTGDTAFCSGVLSKWTVDDTVRFFDRFGITGKEKTLGQLFPHSDKAKDIVAVFQEELRRLNQPVQLNADVAGVYRQADGSFEVAFQQHGDQHTVYTPSVVMASGGLPVAKLGASDFALRIARQFGLAVIPPSPALVPLVITGKDQEWFAALSGNSIFCRVHYEDISFEENILFTHWGLSGPAILQISTYWRPGSWLTIDLLPGASIQQLIAAERESGGRLLLAQLLQRYYSKRFVDALARFLPVDRKIASMSKADAVRAEDVIHRFRVKPAGYKGYDKAEVMRGGVATHELNAATMESIRIPGLFFGGECVDVTGWLGGYNFQWAWACGFVIADSLKK